MLPTRQGSNPASWSLIRRTSNWATKANSIFFVIGAPKFSFLNQNISGTPCSCFSNGITVNNLKMFWCKSTVYPQDILWCKNKNHHTKTQYLNTLYVWTYIYIGKYCHTANLKVSKWLNTSTMSYSIVQWSHFLLSCPVIVCPNHLFSDRMSYSIVQWSHVLLNCPVIEIKHFFFFSFFLIFVINLYTQSTLLSLTLLISKRKPGPHLQMKI